MAELDKARALAALLARLRESLDRLTAAQRSAQLAVTHPDNRQEHSKDMRSTEASYLARGLAERAELLRDGVRAVQLLGVPVFRDDDAAAAGALVAVEDQDGVRSLYLLAPAGAGEILDVDGHKVLVLTPRSPVGAALAGLCAGDAVSVDLPTGRLAGEVVFVR